MVAPRTLVSSVAGAGALLLAVIVPSGAVPGDEDRVAAIQVQLVEARQSVQSLYAQAAAAAEQYNGAALAAARAEQEIAVLDDRITAAESELDAERRTVEALTMEQLTAGRQVTVFQSLLTADGTQQLLERSAAYASTQDAIAGQMARLEAKQAVARSVRAQAAAAARQHREAIERQSAAQAEIEQSIAAAEAQTNELGAEREELLAELARLQDAPIEQVRERQDRVDERIDAAPSQPPRDERPAPAPERPPSPAPKPPPAPTPTPKPPPAPNPNPAGVEAMISYARAQLGKPYVWGAAGPDAFDCSGLTMRALQEGGKSVGHHAAAQYSALRSISPADRQRGDLLFYADASGIYHVTIYLGGGQMIHAPRPGRSVEIVPDSWMGAISYAARPF